MYERQPHAWITVNAGASHNTHEPYSAHLRIGLTPNDPVTSDLVETPNIQAAVQA